MIKDKIENITKYPSILHRDSISKFLRDNNISGLPAGDIEIKGQDLFVKVLRYNPKEAEENDFETHNLYTDVQLIIEGTELIQLVPLESLREKPMPGIEGDSRFFSAEEYISDIVLRKGEFAVFFPNEPHRPGCRYRDHIEPVLKLVFKVKRP